MSYSPGEDLDDLLPRDFDPQKTVDEVGDGNFDPLPNGWYSVRIERAEMKRTKSGDGRYLSLGLEVEGPSHEGRWVFETFNLKNKSKEAQGIAIESFARFCVACGVDGRPRHMRELEGRRLDVKLAIERNEEYGDRNRVKGYAPFGSKAKGGPTRAASPTNSYDDDDLPF